MTKNKFSLYTLTMLSTVALAACQTTSATQNRSDEINSALQRAAENVATQTYGDANLMTLERNYKNDSDDAGKAIAYAHGLRKAQRLNAAATVLAPFAERKDGSSAAKTEFAAIRLEQGLYDQAEKYSQQAILKDEENYQAYHYLGIALDAQSMHEEAERAFRKGLEKWQGDPTTIMNNLALNLTSQKHLEEAEEILEKAKTLAPDKPEIERNLRIVRALQESGGGRINAPTPHAKPAN